MARRITVGEDKAYDTADHVAAILTYIRRSWGNNLSPVLPDTIKRARADGESVRAMWNEETLQQEAERMSKN